MASVTGWLTGVSRRDSCGGEECRFWGTADAGEVRFGAGVLRKGIGIVVASSRGETLVVRVTAGCWADATLGSGIEGVGEDAIRCCRG